jgi:hypothetical protein
MNQREESPSGSSHVSNGNRQTPRDLKADHHLSLMPDFPEGFGMARGEIAALRANGSVSSQWSVVSGMKKNEA